MKGRVSWWNIEKGYGFIEYNNNENIFARIDESEKESQLIKENDEIEFIIEEKANGRFLKLLTQCEH